MHKKGVLPPRTTDRATKSQIELRVKLQKDQERKWNKERSVKEETKVRNWNYKDDP